MQIIDELFYKIVYESDSYHTIQRRIDDEILQILDAACMPQSVSREAVVDEIMDMLYHAERDMFALGFKQGILYSGSLKEAPKKIDRKLPEILEMLLNAQNGYSGVLRIRIRNVLDQAEQEMFTVGVQYGIRLMQEVSPSSDDIHDL